MCHHYNISKYELDYIFTTEFYTFIYVCWQSCSLQLFLVKWSLRLVLPDQMMPLAGLCSGGAAGCTLTLGKVTC